MRTVTKSGIDTGLGHYLGLHVLRLPDSYWIYNFNLNYMCSTCSVKNNALQSIGPGLSTD